MTDHNLRLPRNIDDIDMSIYSVGDSWNDDMIKDGIIAIIRTSQATGIDMWEYLRTYTPEADKGFMFSNDATIGRILQFMEVGHSGTSYGWTMRQLQRIAHMSRIPQRIWLDSRLTNITSCNICQENKNDIVETPCKHHFCGNCIREWIKIQSTCPSCRTTI